MPSKYTLNDLLKDGMDLPIDREWDAMQDKLEVEIRWIEVDGRAGKKMPRWQRSAGIDDGGVVYVPAAISGNELDAALAAAWDGVGVVIYLGHQFLPADWIGREYPDVQDLCDKIDFKVRKFFAGSEPICTPEKNPL